MTSSCVVECTDKPLSTRGQANTENIMKMNHLDAMTGIIFTPKVGTQSPVFFRAFFSLYQRISFLISFSEICFSVLNLATALLMLQCAPLYISIYNQLILKDVEIIDEENKNYTKSKLWKCQTIEKNVEYSKKF